MAIHEQDLMWVYNPTRADFTVKWGGYPYTIRTGEKAVFPRFIADHIAKHLADAILLRREQQTADPTTGRVTPMLRHPVERPRIVNMIVLGVYRPFQQKTTNANDQMAAMVAQAQSQIPGDAVAPDAPKMDDTDYEDYGLVPDSAIGNLEEPDTPTGALNAPLPADETEPVNDGTLLGVVDLPSPENTGTPGEQPAKPKRSKAELLDEAQQLGIKVKGTESAAALEAMIKKF